METLQNIELHRRAIEAYNAHEVEALIVLCDPAVEGHSVFAAVGGAVYHGHDGLRRFFEDVEDAWGAETRMEPEEYFDLGENTLVFLMLHGHGRQSGAEVTMPVAQMARWRDGLCVYFKGYANREDALGDLGVSEDAIEPIAP
jgi:ketosteroid isomerase-like protein